ncbi:MAG: beta-lactamase family protein [Acidobacteria bacterium]|nr:beta-lactamase family protein [Acidobacteriota bacterium]
MRKSVVIFVLFWSLLVQDTGAAQTPAPPLKKPTQSAPAPAAQSPQRKKPESSASGKGRAIDAARIALIADRMKSFVDQGRAAGIVTLVARRGEVVSQNAVGFQDLEKKTPMLADTIFQIASMTKPVTAVGIMILVEDGMLAVTDPVHKYLPNFANILVKVEARERETGNQEHELSEIRKPSRPITIRDLMTHTSGMGGGYPEALKDLFVKRDHTLAEAVDAFPQRRLEFEPGTRWGYSNMGIATLGRIIEVVSGKSYEEFISERIFQPLGMKDSHFFPPEIKYDRIATVYQSTGQRGAEGLKKADVDIYRAGAKYSSPEAGLYSTAPDLFNFYQMMLNGGAFGGKRILSKASVDLMTRVHTGDLKAGFSPGMGFGLGWSVVRNVEGMFRLNSIGTYGHGGLYRTYGFVDPQKELVGIILIQRLSSDGDMADEISALVAMASAAVE